MVGRIMIDGTRGIAEVDTDVESAKREVPTEEIVYVGSLANSSQVERVMDTRSGNELELRNLQGVVAQIRYEAAERRSRRVETA